MPYSSLRDWARSRLQWPDVSAPAAAAPPVRTVVGWITRHPDTLTEDENRLPKAVLDACPELEQTHELVRGFAQMLTQRTGADLPDWIRTAPQNDPAPVTLRHHSPRSVPEPASGPTQATPTGRNSRVICEDQAL